MTNDTQKVVPESDSVTPEIEALITYLRALADGELMCELSRQHLCKSTHFVPSEVFDAIQRDPLKRFVSVNDVHLWLMDQEHRLDELPVEDVAVFILARSNSLGELTFESFVQMTLTIDNLVLHEAAASRCQIPAEIRRGLCQARGDDVARMHAESSYRLCRLFEDEVKLVRHLRTLRQRLRDLRLPPQRAFDFLLSAKALPATNLLSQADMRRLLVDKLAALSCRQCEALFRRMNMNGSGNLDFEEVLYALEPCCKPNDYEPVSALSWQPRTCLGMHSAKSPSADPGGGGTLTKPLALSRGTPADTLARSESASDASNLQKVLRFMAHQARLDMRVEAAKGLLPDGFPIDALFRALDGYDKGFVADADLWQFAQRAGAQVPFSSIDALTRTNRSRRRHGESTALGQISLRELGRMVLKRGTTEFEAWDTADTDDDARSLQYLLRFTDPCPGCGARIQRDAEDVEGCPTVTCPLCGKVFQCFKLVGDGIGDRSDLYELGSRTGGGVKLLSAVEHGLAQVIEASASAAEEGERLRRQLVQGDLHGQVANIFPLLTDSGVALGFWDLDRRLRQHGHSLTAPEFELLWSRFARTGERVVTLSDFTGELLDREA